MRSRKFVLISLMVLSAIALSGPASARYVQSDPIGQAAGPNTYAYVNSDPLSRIDPLGLDDINLIPKNEAMHGWVNKYQDGKNVLSIAVHGLPGAFLVNKDFISGKKLYELLSQDPEFMKQLKDADVVQLNSCRTGKADPQGYNAAQDFANHAGKPTYAPEVWNWRRPDGSFFLGGSIRGESKNGWDRGYEGNLIFWPQGGKK
jgi:uncharacterized protein RhaS with RHS repeats